MIEGKVAGKCLLYRYMNLIVVIVLVFFFNLCIPKNQLQEGGTGPRGGSLFYFW